MLAEQEIDKVSGVENKSQNNTKRHKLDNAAQD
jgi:hypothetical protein